MSYNSSKILIVDDEPDILEIVSYCLKKEGYSVYIANDGKKALQLMEKIIPDLILLDVMMPGMDGIEVCEKIRSKREWEHTRIAFLTARAEDYSQIAAFNAGADDYITKPIKPKILASRVKALLKRQIAEGITNDDEKSGIRKIGRLTIDRERFLILLDDKEIILPKKEFNLLSLLTSKPSKVFSREEIFEKIWGNDVMVGDRTIDVYIRKLREKIGENCIKTIKGIGYKFEI
jgi:two-component system, OmpR family, alkaline phosphatase synthesis response regulator PhoP